MKYYIKGDLILTSDREYTYAVVSRGKPGAIGGVCLHRLCRSQESARRALTNQIRRFSDRPEDAKTMRIVELEVRK